MDKNFNSEKRKSLNFLLNKKYKHKIVIILSILCFLYFCPGIIYSEEKKTLPPKYKKWLDEEVVYIITPKEREIFLKLESDEMRDKFIEEFWRQRDPTSGTPKNEFKEEHYRRIDYANKWFGRHASRPGWMTDQGRIYIILGEPIERKRFDAEQEVYPCELWFYSGDVRLGLEPFFYILFYRRFGAGEYKLYSPTVDGRERLIKDEILLTEPVLTKLKRDFDPLHKIDYDLYLASLSLIPQPGGKIKSPMESDKLLANIPLYPHKLIKDEYVDEFLKTEGKVEVDYSVNLISGTLQTEMIEDEKGNYFLHYSFSPKSLSLISYEDKYSAHWRVNGTIKTQDGKTTYQIDEESSIELTKKDIKIARTHPFSYESFLPLSPGKYILNILFQNTVSKEFVPFERVILIEDKEERINNLVLGYDIKKDTEKDVKKPFKIDNQRIYPSIENLFSEKDKLIIFTQLRKKEGYEENLKLVLKINKSDEALWRKDLEIWDTPSLLNVFESLSLEKFSPGKYTIIVTFFKKEKVIDSKEEEFSIQKERVPRQWIISKIWK
ncbi:MAG: GWxTD domain-containing protein [Acidobacteriota bacterium]